MNIHKQWIKLHGLSHEMFFLLYMFYDLWLGWMLDSSTMKTIDLHKYIPVMVIWSCTCKCSICISHNIFIKAYSSFHHTQSQHDLLTETPWTSTKVILQMETLLHHVWHVFNYWRCWLLVKSYQHFTFFMWYMTNCH
jgi:hypothetical protein